MGFQQQVYEVVRRIPSGMVASYGLVATALDRPRDARQVGRALFVCREADVPCHRVVNRNGVLTGAWAFSSPSEQQATLAAEGVTFDPFGRVVMRLHCVTGNMLTGT